MRRKPGRGSWASWKRSPSWPGSASRLPEEDRLKKYWTASEDRLLVWNLEWRSPLWLSAPSRAASPPWGSLSSPRWTDTTRSQFETVSHFSIKVDTWKGAMLVTMKSLPKPRFWMINSMQSCERSLVAQLLYLCSDPWQACVDDVFQQKLIGQTMVQGEVDHKPFE